MTSSSGSPAEVIMTSISPVEKPVRVGSISTSSERKFAQFQLQDFQVPAGIESDLVVGDPERSLLDLREPGQGDSRDLSKPQRPRGLKPAMASDNMAFGISKNGISEAERLD